MAFSQISETGAGLEIKGPLGLEDASPAAIVASGVVTDDDSAASNGTAVNVVPDADGILAHLESTNAGNADANAEISNGGPTVPITDNDAPGGVALYYDEDATNAHERFLCVSPSAQDLFVPLSDGKLIKVKHDASAASNGVAVYFDDDAANAYERLLFVSPTDADGAFDTGAVLFLPTA